MLSNNHRQSFIEDFRQAKMDRHADFLFQSCLEEEAKGWATPMLQQQEVDAMFPDEWCPTPALSIEQASCSRDASTPRQARAIALPSTRKGCNCTLHSDLQYTASWCLLWPRCRPLQENGGAASRVLRAWRRRPSRCVQKARGR